MARPPAPLTFALTAPAEPLGAPDCDVTVTTTAAGESEVRPLAIGEADELDVTDVTKVEDGAVVVVVVVVVDAEVLTIEEVATAALARDLLLATGTEAEALAAAEDTAAELAGKLATFAWPTSCPVPQAIPAVVSVGGVCEPVARVSSAATRQDRFRGLAHGRSVSSGDGEPSGPRRRRTSLSVLVEVDGAIGSNARAGEVDRARAGRAVNAGRDGLHGDLQTILSC